MTSTLVNLGIRIGVGIGVGIAAYKLTDLAIDNLGKAIREKKTGKKEISPEEYDVIDVDYVEVA